MANPVSDSLQLVSEPPVFGFTSVATFDQSTRTEQWFTLQHHCTNQSYQTYSHFYMASYGTGNYCGEFYQHPYGFEVNGVMQDSYANHCYDTNLGSLPNPYGFECIPRTTSVARDSKHKRCATGGKRKAWRKKHKYELGRQSVAAKLSSKKKVRRVHVQVSNGEWAPKYSVGSEIMKEDQPLVVEGNREIEVHVFDKIPQREKINLKDSNGMMLT
ncbi:hypothetical protein A4A49_00255 [Nicotiana attenuata]|uniref:Uncharacterized protein n=1 Tax=Nicotiana attenuata TaxID=49451 RepID=A0A1J6IEM5_NICAT|nr:hypothetical protein A4A49_00255 [Nicotiana attenuata]